MHRRQFLARASAGIVATAAGVARSQASAANASLAEHHLAAIETRPVPLPWPRLVGRNAKLDIHGRGPTITAVILHTDRGASGWGEILPGPPGIETLREQFLGQPISQLLAAETGILSKSLTPLDVALHDLAGIILDQPVWRLIGGGQTPQLFPIYSGMIYFDDLTPVERPGGIDQVLRNCEADRALGYRQLKVKIGRGLRWMDKTEGIQRDIEVVRAIAGAFPDCQLLVDGNDGFDVPGLITFLKGIQGIPLVWIEEPFVENEQRWREIHDWTRRFGFERTLLADGEQNNDYPLLETLEADGILQVRLCDILGFGFTRWRQLMPRLERTKTQASPHAWGSGLKTIYTAHLLAALGNAPTIEGVTCSHEAVDFGENLIRDGQQQVSNQPGFGLKLKT
ncbi:MAG: hypothetical protein K1X74_03715 [Pirellulales bacterium]|nr:hypothetical protein [Pirellulales bacterium]